MFRPTAAHAYVVQDREVDVGKFGVSTTLLSKHCKPKFYQRSVSYNCKLQVGHSVAQTACAKSPFAVCEIQG